MAPKELWPLRQGAKIRFWSFQYFSMGISGVGQKLNLMVI